MQNKKAVPNYVKTLGTASYYKVFFLCSIGFWSYALRSLEVKIKLYPMLEKDHR